MMRVVNNMKTWVGVLQVKGKKDTKAERLGQDAVFEEYQEGYIAGAK